MSTQDSLGIIGNTPLVEVTCFDTGLCRLFLKLENHNPGGSIKDRIGPSMIEAAERAGKIKPGDTLIEATAGNTGLGLALVAAKKGYRLLLVIPDKMSREKVAHLKAMGAEIVMTRSDVEKGHPDYYQDYARRLSQEIPNSYYIDQFNNPDNPLAHETTTGPEIWSQMNHAIDAVVVGVGSAGTLAGLTRFFQKVHPQIEFVLADPAGSILKDYIETGKYSSAGSWLVEGIGEDFVPAQADFELVEQAYAITDAESFQTARTLLRKEGILAGSSSGTLIAAAVKYAQEQAVPKNIVTFVCDSGNKYLSKMFNDYWMADQGFIHNEENGTVVDLIARKYEDRAVIFASPGEKLLNVYNRMKIYDISQLPVIEHDHVVGIIDEYDILLALVNGGAENFHAPVNRYMSPHLETITPDAKIEAILPLLKDGLTAIVEDEQHFYGLITKIDYINHLKKKLDK
jgi:cystathionine beta-synthase